MYICSCCCCCFSHSAHWLPTRKKLLYTVANPARGLLNREKKKKKKSGSAPSPPPPPARCSFGEKNKKVKKSREASTLSVSHPYKDSYDSSARPMGVASQNSTLPCAIATFPVSLCTYVCIYVCIYIYACMFVCAIHACIDLIDSILTQADTENSVVATR